MSSDDNICSDIFSAYPVKDYLPGIDGDVGIGGLVLGVLYFISAFITLYWIRRQRQKALQGMEGAAKEVIFPIYLPFLWLSSISDLIFGLIVLFVKIKFQESNDWPAAIAIGATFAFQHFVVDGIAFLLMQYGCGYQAVKNALFWSLGWSIATFWVLTLYYRDTESDIAFIGYITWSVILFIFYATLWLTPEKKLFRREAVVFYSRYWTTIRLFALIALLLLKYASSRGATICNCVYALIILPSFAIFKPYIVYKSLLIDSKWWQGISDRNQPRTRYPIEDSDIRSSFGLSLVNSFYNYLESSFHNSSNSQRPSYSKASSRPSHGRIDQGPLHGVEVGFNEAQELAREIDFIRQTGTVRLLNFAYLTVDQSVLLGAGSFSKVYAGYYKGYPVAMKMLFTADINPDVIKRCSNEAKILSEISHHPNVVKIYGITVLPPSVCLVLERCEYGSLSDVIRGYQGGGINRQALKLSMADRMFLALGCALGLEALHSYSPDLCHRDIKSFNFLIDSQLNAKIADLDLGQQIEQPRGTSDTSRDSIRSRHSSSDIFGGSKHSLKDFAKSNMNITWQAPEVLLSQGYTQKSDIYSLSLVLWEIIATGVTIKRYTTNSISKGDSGNSMDIKTHSKAQSHIPFEDCKNQAEVREKIVRGFRPSMAPFIDHRQKAKHNQNDNLKPPFVDPLYVDIITDSWNPDPQARPNISSIVKQLRRCWNNCVHKYIYETEYIINLERIHEENFKMSLIYDAPMVNDFNLTGSAANFTRNLIHTTSNLISSSYPPDNNMMIRGDYHTLTTPFAPSPELMETMKLMKYETNWLKLDDDENGCYVVISSEKPYFMFWVTKKWTQLMGYMVYDMLANEFRKLYGPSTGSEELERLFMMVGYGQSQHVTTSLMRRDGKEVLLSLHMFPVYDSSKPDFLDSGFPMQHEDSSTDSSFVQYRPAKLSFSAKRPDDANLKVGRSSVKDMESLLAQNPLLQKPSTGQSSSYGTPNMMDTKSGKSKTSVAKSPSTGLFDILSRSPSSFSPMKDFLPSNGNNSSNGNKATLPNSPTRAITAVNTYNNTQLSQIRDDPFHDGDHYLGRETDSLLGEEDHDIEQSKHDDVSYSTPIKNRSPTPTKENPSPIPPVAINFVASPAADTTGIVGVPYKRVAYIVIQCSAIKEL